MEREVDDGGDGWLWKEEGWKGPGRSDVGVGGVGRRKEDGRRRRGGRRNELGGMRRERERDGEEGEFLR